LLAWPWSVYQLWAFFAPGLSNKERRSAIPFVLLAGGLFIGSSLFAYFVALRSGLEFLLRSDPTADAILSNIYYFDLFATLGIGLAFEVPVLIFLLTLLRVASPRFLLRHSRYAILGIVIIAAIVTPTSDVFNLLLFALPTCALYYAGVGAILILVMKREGARL